jgi:biotin operon repressor
MSEDDTDTLPERQQELLTLLNEESHTGPELAEAMRGDILPGTVRDHIGALRKRGIAIGHDSTAGFFLGDGAQQHIRKSTRAKQSITRELNEWATEQERIILRRLKAHDDVTVSLDTSDDARAFEAIYHLTDLHVGDVVEVDGATLGRHADGAVEIYNDDVIGAVVPHTVREALREIRNLESLGWTCDGIHVLFGGDMSTGESHYSGQQLDIRMQAADQVTTAVDLMRSAVETFADELPWVQVVSVVGNHGFDRGSATTGQNNLDLMSYRWLKDVVRRMGYDNVRFVTAETSHQIPFELRGGRWTHLLTHGQNVMKHIDATSRSQSDWRGKLIETGFDGAWTGHYHGDREASVMNGPRVVRSPSPKPGSDFASMIGVPDAHRQTGHAKRLATFAIATDDRPLERKRVIDDIGMSPTISPHAD